MKRDALIDENIRLAWDSLVSHLDALKGNYDGATTPSGRRHHIAAMKQYSKIIHNELHLY